MSNIEDIKVRIGLLNGIYEESSETIKHLNILVSEHTAVRDNEIKKRESLRRKINLLTIELNELTN